MKNFVKNLFLYTVPALLNRGVQYFLAKESAPVEAAEELSSGLVSDFVVMAGALTAKTLVKAMAPGVSTAAHAVGGLVGSGLNATLNESNDSIARTLLKGTAGAVAASIVTPALAIPAIIATDYAVDSAINVGKNVYSFAYDKYQHSLAPAKVQSENHFNFTRPTIAVRAVA